MSPVSTGSAACVALPCGGDAREACGGKDAIIMYQDPKFTVPTVTQLAGMVFDYEQLAVNIWEALKHLFKILTSF